VEKPVTANPKTSALIALARSRRQQRALAHAYLHRDAPLPTLHLSLGFVTSTACTSGPSDELGHRMTIAGAADGIAYIVEELSTGDDSVVYKLFLHGSRAGHLVPCASLPRKLTPCAKTTTEAWMLSTRIVQRRALRMPSHDGGPPIRKYALQLRVEPVSGLGASGHATVTAFLRPDARLVDVWIPEGNAATAIARVTYTGVPSGLGLPKDTVVLLTE
jgi:hypothetical protein